MKYKVDDKVIIKTWDQMEKEFGLRNSDCIDCIDCSLQFTNAMELLLNEKRPDRVVTIASLNKNPQDIGYYDIKGEDLQRRFSWTDDMIICKEKPVGLFENNSFRFGLMDI